MSKYSSLLQQAKQEPSPISEEPKAKANKPAQEVETEAKVAAEPVAPVIEQEKEVSQPVVDAAVPSPSKVLNMEPPRGKKGHSDYNQVTIYLKKQTQKKAKIALLQAQEERDFSELVEDLLTDWLSSKSPV